MKIVDISRTISERIKLHPPYGNPEITLVMTPDMPKAKGRTTRSFNGILHTGTHIDCPEHMVPGGTTVDKIPLETFAGEALLIDMVHKGPRAAIGAEDLEKAAGKKVRPGDRIIIRTNWNDANFGTEKYFENSPYLTPDGAEWCIAKKVVMVCGDFYPTQWDDEEFTSKRMLLQKGIPMLFDLENLDKIKSERVMLWSLPLKFENCEASMTRAVVVEKD